MPLWLYARWHARLDAARACLGRGARLLGLDRGLGVGLDRGLGVGLGRGLGVGRGLGLGLGRARGNQAGFSTAEGLAGAALAVVALIAIWAAMKAFGLDIIRWMQDQITSAGGGVGGP
jgi:hypothetical protein